MKKVAGINFLEEQFSIASIPSGFKQGWIVLLQVQGDHIDRGHIIERFEWHWDHDVRLSII